MRILQKRSMPQTRRLPACSKQHDSRLKSARIPYRRVCARCFGRGFFFRRASGGMDAGRERPRMAKSVPAKEKRKINKSEQALPLKKCNLMRKHSSTASVFHSRPSQQTRGVYRRDRQCISKHFRKLCTA